MFIAHLLRRAEERKRHAIFRICLVPAIRSPSVMHFARSRSVSLIVPLCMHAVNVVQLASLSHGSRIISLLPLLPLLPASFTLYLRLVFG